MATVTKGRTFVSGETVTPAKLNELVDSATVTNIADADVSASAAIAHSKLANITAGQVLLGNASNVPTATALSGDVTVTSGGVTAIGSAKVLPAMLSQPFTLETAKASTSGTSIDFTSIPSWAKRIVVIFNGVSTNATGGFAVIVQLGVSGAPTTSGYTTVVTTLGASTVSTAAGTTAGFPANQSIAAAAVFTGQMVIANITGNTWVASNSCSRTDSAVTTISNGSVALSGALNMVRVTTSGGTDSFDAGTINIAYEG